MPSMRDASRCHRAHDAGALGPYSDSNTVLPIHIEYGEAVDSEVEQGQLDELGRWRIWFDDGSSHAGTTVEKWNALPKHGVLYVKHNRINHMGLDYYWIEDDTVKSCNRMDIDRYLERDDGIRNVKFGRWASNYIWERVHQEAKDCKDC